jgi:small subunit ribosomal protein S9
VSKTSTGKYIEGIGRRKTSIARVRIVKGEATNSVNEKPIDKYFVTAKQMADAVRPLVVAGLMDKYYFTAKVSGGGISGQVGAIALGLARALVEMDPELRHAFRPENLLTRDPRMVERKKYHHVKARKKPQFSKR